MTPTLKSPLSRRAFLRNTALLASASLLSPLADYVRIAAANGGSIVLGTVGDLNNLDPFVMTANNYPMMENVYDQFVRLDNKVNPQPGIIQEWTPSTDGTQLTLKMRQGVVYHDGSKATVADVVASIRRAADATNGGNQYPNWQTLKDVSASGNDTVNITFAAPVAYIIPALGFISLIRPGAVDTLKSSEGGSGPFQVKEWVPGDHLDLVRFPGYWDQTLPKLDSARIKFYSDEAAMVAAFEQGAIDIVLNLPPREYARLKPTYNITRGQDAANFYYLGMNPTMPPFDKKEVRQAMAYALDKKTMTQNVLFGVSDPIGTPYPDFSIAHFPELETMYPFDLDKAKQLLTQAGYPNGITFSIATTDAFPEFSQFAQILQANLATIGSTVTIESMDVAQWVPILLGGKFGAIFSFAGGTQWFPTRITLSNNFATTKNIVWPNGNPPDDYVKGMTQADTSFDPAAQAAGMKLAVTSLMDEMWAAPIAFRYSLFAQQKTISGFDHGVYDQPRLAQVTSSK